MSLKRLHEAVKSLIRPHIDEHGRLSCGGTVSSENNQQHMLMSRWSDMIKKAYVLSNFSSTFMDEDHQDERAIRILQKMNCFNDSADFLEVPSRVGMGDDSDISGKKFTQPFLQDLTITTIHDLSDQDLQCLLRALKKHYDAVTEEDEHDEVKKYRLLLQDKHSAQVDDFADTVFVQLQECCNDGALIFADSFVHVLCQNYLKPLMIERGISRENAVWLTQGVKSNIAMALSGPVMHQSLSDMITHAVCDMLRSIGLDPYSVSKIQTEIDAVVATSQDSYNLLQLGMDGVGADAGQFAAHQVIHHLPRLNTPVTADDQEVEVELPAAINLRVVC